MHRVLVLAEAANPEFVSVPLVAWCLSEALSRKMDVHVVTHIRNRDALCRHGWTEGDQFTIIDTEWVSRIILRTAEMLGSRDNKGWTILQALSPIGCYAFEAAAWRKFGKAIAEGQFDIVHRVTPVSPTSPSLLAPRLKRLGVPLVVGPLNGGLPWPAGFEDRLRKEREWLSHVRSAFKLLPGYRSLRRDAAALIAGSRFTLSQIHRAAHAHTFYLPENGIDPHRFQLRRTRRAGLPLVGAFLGRLVPYKAADVLIKASADLLRAGKLRLEIMGDGPERPALESLVGELGVRDAVSFHGHVEHRRVQEILVNCDFLACPSIREFGGGVVLEAMSVGLTPIVADYGGPAELIDDASGIRVPFSNAQSLVAGFRAVLESLAETPGRLDTIGKAAAQRVAELFTWDQKAEQIAAVYDWVTNRGSKPDLLKIKATVPDCPLPDHRSSDADPAPPRRLHVLLD